MIRSRLLADNVLFIYMRVRDHNRINLLFPYTYSHAYFVHVRAVLGVEFIHVLLFEMDMDSMSF